jgi:hypothetical protein
LSWYFSKEPTPVGIYTRGWTPPVADEKIHNLKGFSAARMTGWFNGKDPWPSLEPAELVLLQTIEVKRPG